MQMLYQSDQFVVMRFEVASPEATPAPPRGGYEIVDKFARKEIYLDGLLAESFRSGVQNLIDQGTDPEGFDAYIARFSALAQQPVVMH